MTIDLSKKMMHRTHVKTLLRATVLCIAMAAQGAGQTQSLVVQPSTGTGLTQVFAFRATAASSIRTTAFLFSSSTDSNACSIVYDVAYNRLWLVDPSTGARRGPITATAPAATAACEVALGTTTVNSARTDVQVAVSLKFSSLFTGTKQISMHAPLDSGAYTHSVQVGTWTVGPAVATGTPIPVTSLSVTPISATITSGATQQFTASGSAASAGVRWSTTLGTISATGLYVAPSSLTQLTGKVVATSVSDATKIFTAPIIVNPAVAITVTSSATALVSSGVATLNALVTGSSNTAVTWVQPQIGSLSSVGNMAVYNAPSVLSGNTNVEITVKSVADPSKIAKILLSLTPLVSVALSPTTPEVVSGSTLQMSAVVTGTSNTAVKWSLTGQGTLSLTGLYTPPEVATDTVVTVTAAAQADPAKSATANIRVKPRPAVKFSFTDAQITRVAYNGINYASKADTSVEEVFFRSSDGTLASLGSFNPSMAVRTMGSNYLEHVFNKGRSRQFTVRTTMETPDARTGKITFSVTNNDLRDDLVRMRLLPFSLVLPGIAQQYHPKRSALIVGQYEGEPAQILTGAWGSVAFWQDNYPTNATLGTGYGSPEQQVFALRLRTWSTRYESSVPVHYDTVIRPGETREFTYYLRFGASTETVRTLAPEGYQAYLTAFPNLVNWPDRRPIGTWFIAEGSKRSAKNPRGYLWDPNLDVSNAADFRRAVLQQADGVITRMNNMNPKPSGLIIWDLEGQEFNHAFTYIGYPNRIDRMAPEMNAVADELLARFKAAGYEIGLTVRPQTFGMGNALPAGCNSKTSTAPSTDVYLKLDAPFPFRGFQCVGGAWQQPGPFYPGTQTDIVADDEAIVAKLAEKVEYARKRWGVRMFYVDSNVFSTGNTLFDKIFRRLHSTCSDCLFIPEWSNQYYPGATAPYFQARRGWYRTDDSYKTIYPNAFSVIDTAESDMVTNWNTIVSGVRNGDVLLFRAWFDSPEKRYVERAYQEASIAK